MSKKANEKTLKIMAENEAKQAEELVLESEMDEYLLWRLESARNLIDLTILALTEDHKELIYTGLEDLYDRFQGMLDDFCVED
jgi:hypothetical protein